MFLQRPGIFFLTMQLAEGALIIVVDPGCLSWILIFFHPGSWIQQQQKEEEKYISCPIFL
jgi:hypothetical protein